MILVESSASTTGTDDWPENKTSCESAPSQSASWAHRPTASPPASKSTGIPSGTRRPSTRRPSRWTRLMIIATTMPTAIATARSPTWVPSYRGRSGIVRPGAFKPPQSPNPTKTR
jgi:hypothetical protein